MRFWVKKVKGQGQRATESGTLGESITTDADIFSGATTVPWEAAVIPTSLNG